MEEVLPGRELDALIAEKVMGWVWYDASAWLDRRLLPPDRDPITTCYLPNYSTDIAAAWQVIKRMQMLGWHYEVGDHHHEDKQWVKFGRGDYDQYDDFWSDEYIEAAATAELAICIAALAAVGSPQEVAHGRV